ncbi:unnamed protein product [Leuciscus chuanchicus]
MKSSGMNLSSGTRTRSVLIRGFTLALVLLTTCACTDCTDRNVTAQAGEAAVLPCTCPPDQPPYLVWQKTVGDQILVVRTYRGEDNTEDNQAEEYRNRTELKLTESCSLTLLSVTPSDQGLYTCYYRTEPITHERICLEVTEIQAPPEKLWTVQKTVVTSSVCGLLIMVIISVAAAVYVGITRKNRRRMNGGFTAALTSV